MHRFPIVVTNESSTSVCLLWILLHEYWQIEKPLLVRADQVSGNAFLLIGDAALQQREQYMPAGYVVYDLAEIWQQLTGSPFVFAQWATHNHTTSTWRKHFNRRLNTTIHKHIAASATLAVTDRKLKPTQTCDLNRYLRQLTYILGEPEQRGMRIFRKKAERYGFIHDDL